jgi:hypothetical protein
MALSGDLCSGENLPVAQVKQTLHGVDEIVFAVRQRGKNDHYYVNFGNWCGNPNKWEYGRGGRLCKWNVHTGRTTILADDPPGAVRDPQLHYDGDKILFSYRPGRTHRFHLYEISIDGSEELQKNKRFDMPDFRPSMHYVRIMKDLGILKRNLPRNAPIDVYATDEAYWQSFWPQ